MSQRFEYPENLRKSYRRRLRLIARDTLSRLKRLPKGLTLLQFEALALGVKSQVLLEHQGPTAEWFVRTVATRNSRDFQALGLRSRLSTEDLVQQFRARQLGVVESLVDHIVKDAISRYEARGNLAKMPIAQHSARADFYAQDQVGVFYNDLTRLRSQAAGATQYTWVRTTSLNPRDFHLERVGKTFTFGHLQDEPGVLPNCKCTARPILDAP